ncbi:MAG TPA: hypothetical protein VLT45_24350, partial [Kofleriaceae bacterium]|nr:hypothetical protein [Kofleriaceae bacterium]
VLWQEPAFIDTTVTPMTLSFASPGAGDGHALAISYELNDGRDYPSYALSYNAPPMYLDWSQLAPFAANVVLSADNSVRWEKGTFVGGELGIEVTLSAQGARWHVLLPPGQTAFTAPPIPSDLVLPPMMTAARVSYVGGNDPAGYRALRTDPDVFDLYHWAQVTPATPGVFRFAGD